LDEDRLLTKRKDSVDDDDGDVYSNQNKIFKE
jgi:hypothetical protein